MSFVVPVNEYWFKLSLISGKLEVLDWHVVGVSLVDFVVAEGELCVA